MFSAKKNSFKRDDGYELWRRARKRFSPYLSTGFRPRVGIRIWLTALFMLVTAVASVTAYEIVRPIIFDSLDRASKAAFQQVGQQFEEQNRRSDSWSTQRIKSFAATRGLQWGIVQAKDGKKLQGDADLEWLPNVVNAAASEQRTRQNLVPVPSGLHEGQRQATYAAPIAGIKDSQGNVIPNTVLVFNKFFTKSDVENAEETIATIERIVFLAGALALLIAGFAGYFAAVVISRRVSRLGIAAERLAAGNFDERIKTRIQDEVGALGTTFNDMAASLKGAFGQVEQEKERGRAILDGMTDAVVGVDRRVEPNLPQPSERASFWNPRTSSSIITCRRSWRRPATLVPSRNPRPNAGDRIIEIRAAPLEYGALAILRDVTEERRIQRAKSTFIANASHELKTPLTALSGYLEMLEDERDDEVRTDFLEAMRVATERLQGLARTLLDLSRLDANAVVFRSEEVYLEELLHELRRDFGFTGRPLNVHVEEDVPPVETDPNQIHRALTILLDNALKVFCRKTHPSI